MPQISNELLAKANNGFQILSAEPLLQPGGCTCHSAISVAEWYLHKDLCNSQPALRCAAQQAMALLFTQHINCDLRAWTGASLTRQSHSETLIVSRYRPSHGLSHWPSHWPSHRPSHRPKQPSHWLSRWLSHWLSSTP